MPIFEVETFDILDFGGHKYVQMMRILAQMILPAQNIAIQNVQVPTFEVGTFEIFGVGCHKYVDMLPFSTQLNPILNNYVNDLR